MQGVLNIACISLCSLWEALQTFIWAIFGLIDLDNFELTGIKEFTRFFGLLMFGTFSVINIIVLLNLLIAMMNHSYQLISVSSVSRIQKVQESLEYRYWGVSQKSSSNHIPHTTEHDSLNFKK